MKKIFILALLGIVVSCTSKQSESNAVTTAVELAPVAQVQDIKSPYPVIYSSKFVMDDPKNAESLLKLWKAWDDGDFNAFKDIFADTVELHFANGMTIRASRDSIVSDAQRERTKLQAARSSVDAIMAVKSTDRNEHWAMIWGVDRSTRNGKTDSTYLQETWKFDSTGKANLMFQYKQTPPAPPKPKK